MGRMIGIGVYFAKKNSTTNDFYLGGRKLGPLVTAMSAEASDMSSWLLMGLPGVAYVTGVCDCTANVTVSSKSFGNNKPVNVCSNSKSGSCPECITNTCNISNTRKSH